jgi:C-terminal processing protease CtpA/Prc
MNKIKSVVHFSVLLLLITSAACSQQKELSSEIKASTVKRISELINDNYVFPDVAKKTSAMLETRLKSGVFDTIRSAKSFAQALTETVQSVNHDKHMRIRLNANNDQGKRNNTAPDNGGFRESKIIEGNIGYIDMRGFLPPTIASTKADEHMKKLGGVSAMIIDLRRNGGGSPDMVQYLCSYFFDDRVHLNSLYYRTTNQTTDYYTIDVNGKKMSKVPLFILTSTFTFSGAEEFCYNMQTQKRATLIGETTGGGANPGGSFSINETFSIFIPTGRAINPVTGTNWEGVGVVPDVKISAEDALDKAIELIRNTAKNRIEP